jgi:hypothetical protein
MKEAYLTTIRDFEIELYSCKWYEWRRMRYLNKQIEYFEGLLRNLEE